LDDEHTLVGANGEMLTMLAVRLRDGLSQPVHSLIALYL
jgi:hypothetical protein